MKVKDFLDTAVGITSVGICDTDGNCIAPELDIFNVCNYAMNEIDNISFFIYDEPATTINGEKYTTQKIRAVIYIK